jgi:Asp-tRNA(Asn)/Glu-tRNA(Gln) amidotransferase A subunit family amidase
MAISLRDLARDIAEGRTTARESAESCLAEPKAAEQDIQAWVPFDQASALARADSALPGGPLSGIPLGVKDIFDTAELPTEWGSEVYRGRQPGADCALVA